jgi:hypothetical protein
MIGKGGFGFKSRKGLVENVLFLRDRTNLVTDINTLILFVDLCV